MALRGCARGRPEGVDRLPGLLEAPPTGRIAPFTDEGRLMGALRVRTEACRSYVGGLPPSVAGVAAAGESASGARMRERLGMRSTRGRSGRIESPPTQRTPPR